MVIAEFRIPLPMDVSKYHVAQLYMVAEESKNNTGGGEGIIVLKNEPFSDERGTGQYTHKVYNIASKVPSWMTKVLSANQFEFHEEAWNCYPDCKTTYSHSYLGKDILCIYSKHLQDTGTQENVFQLDDKKLSERSVVMINITDRSQIDESKYDPQSDPTLVTSERFDFLPLKHDFAQTFSPIMTAYKLYEINIRVPLIGSTLARRCIPSIIHLLAEFHRKVVCSFEKWFDLTIEDIRTLEDSTAKELNIKIQS